MKKLLTAVLIKLLIAILVMSSTAMAAEKEGKAAEGTQVNATYVTPLKFSLTITAINFGDIFTNSAVAVQTITANIEGEPDETFTYTVSSESVPVTLSGQTEGTKTILTNGTANFDFVVGLDTTKITADFVTETVTVSIAYDSIEGTSSS